MKATEFLIEATPGLESVGVPKKLAARVAKEYTIGHKDTPKEVTKLNMKDMEHGIIFRVNNDGTAYAIRKGKWGGSGWTVWTYDPKTDKVKESTEQKFSDAKKRFGAKKGNGKFYFLNTFHEYRGDKPASDVASVRDREEVGVVSDYDIYEYMDKTFLPKIQDKLNKMADAIYAGLREIPRGYDKYGRNPSFTRGTQSARELALEAAETIEEVAEEGFNRKTMDRFLNTYGTLHHGWASVPNNARELERLLKEEPAARAKLAKALLEYGREYYDEVQELKMDILKNAMNDAAGK